MSFPFIGRKHELELLSSLLTSRIASLAVVMGRRRIGKSRLIEEFAKKYTFYHFSGLPPSSSTTNESQLKEFAHQLSIQTGLPEIYADDWSKLFFLLAEKSKEGRLIILFDEISWMGSKDPDFLGKLKIAWDLYFKKNPKLIMLLCGSVSSWIDKNILSSTGFFGRISFTLTLEELPLQDCNEFWLDGGSYSAPYEKLKVLSITGGVPSYLELIKPSLSAEENIRNLCFTKSGPLVNEFDHIFSDLFSHRSLLYKKIVKALGNSPVEFKDIPPMIGRLPSGAIIGYLEDLVKSGFISRDYTWHISSGVPSKLSHFRLSDNYLRFYLKYIDKALPKINNNEFEFKPLSLLPGWDTFIGLQFENLVLKNRSFIRRSLRIDTNDVVSNNPFFQRKTKEIPGCQIDYLIQTKFGCLYVCEIKFSKHPIGKSVITEVQEKIQRLVRPKGFSIRPVLIHVNGVHEDVIASGFFAEIIDFGQLLGSSGGSF